MPTKNKKETETKKDDYLKPASLCTSDELQNQKKELDCCPSEPDTDMDARDCKAERKESETTNPKQKKPRSETWYLTKEVRKLNKTMERILRQLETANTISILSASGGLHFEEGVQEVIKLNGTYEKFLKENAQRIFEEKHKKGDEEE
jgi:hypothetical protein